MNERLAYMEKEGLQTSLAFAELKLEKAELEKSLKGEGMSAMDRFLSNTLNIDPDRLTEVKEKLQESLSTIYSSVGQISDSMISESLLRLDSYVAHLDQQMEEAQQRQNAAEQSMRETQQRRQQMENQLENARGSKREYLIKQIAKERAEEQKLANEKKKAAEAEAKVAQQKEATEKKRQELEAKGQLLAQASATADNVATAAAAVRAGVDAVAGASKMGFPAMLPAIIASVAAVAAAVMSAKKLAGTIQTAKLANGGELDGPSHAEGGIRGTGRFSNIEVEGGEYVTNKHAYANNREAIERINAIGRSVRFVAIQEHQVRRRMAAGGALSENGTSGANALVTGDMTPVANETLIRIEGLLGKIEQHAAATAIKPPLVVDRWLSSEIVDMAESVKQDKQVGNLFKN